MTVLLSPLVGQSNDVVDQILTQERLECAGGAYLALIASGSLPEDETPERAWDFLREQRWFKTNKGPTDPLTLGEYSYMLMRLFGMTGGVMYTLFPSPRYAARELGYLAVVPRDSGAYRYLTGSEALGILGVIMRSVGGEQ